LHKLALGFIDLNSTGYASMVHALHERVDRSGAIVVIIPA